MPFFVAIPLFLVPRLYFGQEIEDFARINDKVLPFGEYLKAIFPVVFQKLSWLWFLPVLFITSILTYPVLAWSQRRKKGIPLDLVEDGKLVLS